MVNNCYCADIPGHTCEPCKAAIAQEELAALRAERAELRTQLEEQWARVAVLESTARGVLACNDKACTMTPRCEAQCQADAALRVALRYAPSAGAVRGTDSRCPTCGGLGCIPGAPVTVCPGCGGATQRQGVGQ